MKKLKIRLIFDGWWHGRWQRGKRELWSPWIFIHGTDNVEDSLMVLFFYLLFPLSRPGNFSANPLGSSHLPSAI